jgi:flagellin-like protein
MRARSSRARRGVSPVLATIVLIVITLSTGVAVAGYTFTLFGRLQMTANVEVVSASCSVSGAACVIDLRNSGNGVAIIPGPYACTVYGTTAASAINGGTNSVGLPPEQDTTLACQFGTLPQTAIPGIHAEGAVTMSDGMQVPFFVNWNP